MMETAATAARGRARDGAGDHCVDENATTATMKLAADVLQQCSMLQSEGGSDGVGGSRRSSGAAARQLRCDRRRRPTSPTSWPLARPPTRRDPALNSSSTHRSTYPSGSYRARQAAVDSVLRRGTEGEGGEEEAGEGGEDGSAGGAGAATASTSARATAGPAEEVPTVRPMGPSMLSRVPRPRPAGFCVWTGRRRREWVEARERKKGRVGGDVARG